MMALLKLGIDFSSKPTKNIIEPIFLISNKNRLPSAYMSPCTPCLQLTLPTSGNVRDFNPLEIAHAEHTTKKAAIRLPLKKN